MDKKFYELFGRVRDGKFKITGHEIEVVSITAKNVILRGRRIKVEDLGKPEYIGIRRVSGKTDFTYRAWCFEDDTKNVASIMLIRCLKDARQEAEQATINLNAVEAYASEKGML